MLNPAPVPTAAVAVRIHSNPIFTKKNCQQIGVSASSKLG
jgi:hypothetical protein